MNTRIKKRYITTITKVVNLFNFFKDKKISLFIQIGSSSEYGNVKVPHKESYLGRPKGIYGKIKLNATNFLIEKFYKNKFPVVIVRFYQLYGPFQDYNRFIPQLIKASVTKSLFFTSPGNQFRDFYTSTTQLMLCLN